MANNPPNPLVILKSDRSRPFAHRQGQRISLQSFYSHVDAVAAALPERRQVINFCGDRYLFAVALAAALSRGQVTLLPADRNARNLRLLGPEFDEALVLVDEAAPIIAGRKVFPIGAAVPRGRTRSWTLESVGSETPAVVVFTSGSTGKPVAHPKTWGSLGESARLIGAILGQPAGTAAVATVPPQHMYGLELSVLVPLRSGLVLDSAKPFFPADVALALQAVAAPRILVTTPVHLRVLAAAGIELPELQLIVSATAPLAPALAAECERQFGAPVVEIYGCTEAGSIASRRTVTDPDWTPFDTVRLTVSGSICQVDAPHLPRPVELADRIEGVDGRRFRLLGRTTDLVNIAGKRHSLGALHHVLMEIPGVLDGAMFIPEEAGDGKSVRPVAFVVAPGLSAEAILEHLRARLDPVFVPRGIHFVDSLPRNETAKLPRQALEQLFREYSANGKSTV